MPDDASGEIRLLGEVRDFADRRGSKVFSYFTGEVWKGDLTGRAVVPYCDPNPVPIIGALEAVVAADGTVTGTVREIRESFSCQGGPQSGVLDRTNPFTGTKTAEAFVLDLYGEMVTLPIVGTHATADAHFPGGQGSGVFYTYTLDCLSCEPSTV